MTRRLKETGIPQHASSMDVDSQGGQVRGITARWPDGDTCALDPDAVKHFVGSKPASKARQNFFAAIMPNGDTVCVRERTDREQLCSMYIQMKQVAQLKMAAFPKRETTIKIMCDLGEDFANEKIPQEELKLELKRRVENEGRSAPRPGPKRRRRSKGSEQAARKSQMR